MIGGFVGFNKFHDFTTALLLEIYLIANMIEISIFPLPTKLQGKSKQVLITRLIRARFMVEKLFMDEKYKETW